MKREEIREQIFAARPRPTATIDLYGVPIVLHKATWHEMQEARRAAVGDDGIFNVDLHHLALLILCAKDEAGNPVFERTDREDLLSMDAEELDRLVQANMALHGLTAKQRDAEKNGSGRTGDAAQSSASVGT